MTLSDYFSKARGIGVLAVADSRGNVDVAVYSRPYFADEQHVFFVMADRLLHQYLQSNPKAAYLFKEAGEGYVGKRLFLTKSKEDDDPAAIDALFKEKNIASEYRGESKYIVYFHVDKELPLVGE